MDYWIIERINLAGIGKSMATKKVERSLRMRLFQPGAPVFAARCVLQNVPGPSSDARE